MFDGLGPTLIPFARRVTTRADIASVWPQVDEWTGLATIASPRDGDLARVTDADGDGSRARAIYSASDAEWQLESALFSTAELMEAFPHPVRTLAIAGVGSDDDETAIRYVYDGVTWVPSASPPSPSDGQVWMLTSANDVPEGVADGDIGLFLPSLGRLRVYRYKAACTVDALAGGGTRAAWIPPQAYAGTPIIRAWWTGAESALDLGLQGANIQTTNGGTVGPVAGYTRVNAPVAVFPAFSTTAEARLPSITGAQPFYLRAEVRSPSRAGTATCGVVQIPTANTQYRFDANGTTLENRSMGIDGNAATRRAGGLANWPTSTPTLLEAITGAVMSDHIETLLDGHLYSSARRNFGGATTASTCVLSLYCNGNSDGLRAQLEARHLLYLTW